ncbi:hypothetical protein HMPREF1210_02565 [Paenisporosarcina sp. HGH0030]|uniref:DUF4083 family protein n=1 Tax=Paenisporosarcina sp. HGH0030 TaxID=1078085 RepID=UPI00034E1BCB|nr:DUF4083 family protein [Paenisporosarcina sp. HGH0030]EPD50596.1 hypothetical protein HMPREF1210_02565 [Paenisporosarcina sp. HGH0030]
MEIILNLIIITLSLVGAMSFTLFIRRLLINSSLRNTHYKDIETKLDEIKDLLLNERTSP